MRARAEHAAQAGDPALARDEPAGEAEARVLLGERFRSRGLRVRYDVRLHEPGLFDVTVDGYDPEARIGFEYIASAERDTDLVAEERARLAAQSTHRILILDEASRQSVLDAADEFLRALGR